MFANLVLECWHEDESWLYYGPMLLLAATLNDQSRARLERSITGSHSNDLDAWHDFHK